MRINKKCKNLIYITLIGVTVVTSLLLKNNNLKSIDDINIEKEIINSKKVNFKTLAMYKNDGEGDTPITTMPESGYTINIDKSYCTIDNINKVYNKMYTDEFGQHIITG